MLAVEAQPAAPTYGFVEDQLLVGVGQRGTPAERMAASVIRIFFILFVLYLLLLLFISAIISDFWIPRSRERNGSRKGLWGRAPARSAASSGSSP